MQTNLVQIVSISGDLYTFSGVVLFLLSAILVVLFFLCLFLGRKSFLLFFFVFTPFYGYSDTMDDMLYELQAINEKLQIVAFNLDPTGSSDYMRATLWAIENLIRGSEADGGLIGQISRSIDNIRSEDIPDILDKLQETINYLSGIETLLQGLPDLKQAIQDLMQPLNEQLTILDSIRSRLDNPLDVNIVSPLPLPVEVQGGVSVVIEGEVDVDIDDQAIVDAIKGMNSDQNNNWYVWGSSWQGFRSTLEDYLANIGNDLSSVRSAVNDPLTWTSQGAAFRVKVEDDGGTTPDVIADGIKRRNDSDYNEVSSQWETDEQTEKDKLAEDQQAAADITDDFDADTDVGLDQDQFDDENPIPFLDFDFDFLNLGIEKDYDWWQVSIDPDTVFGQFFSGDKPDCFKKKWMVANLNFSDGSSNLSQYYNAGDHESYPQRFREKMDTIREVLSHLVTIGLFFAIIYRIRGLAPK